MNRENKIYTTISVLTGLILLYSLISVGIFLTRDRFDLLLNWRYAASIFPTLVGLAGIIVFAATRFEKSELLRAYMCYNIFLAPFIILGIINSINRAQKYNHFRGLDLFLGILIPVILIVCSCTGVWLLSKKRKPLLSYVSIGGESFAEFAPAQASLRFFNRLIDLIIITFVLYVDIIDNYFLRNLFRNTGAGMLILIEFVITLYYYLILESIFSTSIGKIITSTMVVNDRGSRPGFAQVLGRTLCRYIPFEPFSFFGKNALGWHDTMSGTFVVQSIKEGNFEIPAEKDKNENYLSEFAT